MRDRFVENEGKQPLNGSELSFQQMFMGVIKLIYIPVPILVSTVEPRFNEPLYNEVLGITNDILQPGQSYSNMYGTEPPYNDPQYNEILVTTNTIEEPKHKISPYIGNKCHHATKDERRTDQQQ